MTAENHPESRPLTHQYELSILGEECGQLIQVVGKTMRFGYETYSDSETKETNLDCLHKELGDILGAIDFAVERGLLDREQLVTQQFTKRKELMQFAPATTYVSPRQQMAFPDDITEVSHPAAAPVPQPLTIYHEPIIWWKRGLIAAAIIASMFGIGYLVVNQISGPAEQHLAALQAYNTCQSQHQADATSACAELAKAAGLNNQ